MSTTHTCASCGQPFEARRSDARTCSAACRMADVRRRAAADRRVAATVTRLLRETDPDLAAVLTAAARRDSLPAAA